MKILYILAFILIMGCGQGAERHIHLNGEHLDAEGIGIVDRLFDFKVADGNYWINDAGHWGYENNSNPAGTININAAIQMQAEQMPQPGQIQRQPSAHGGNGNGNGNQGYRAPGNTKINNSQNGSVVSGNIDGKRCTFVSAGGMTMKSCK